MLTHTLPLPPPDAAVVGRVVLLPVEALALTMGAGEALAEDAAEALATMPGFATGAAAFTAALAGALGFTAVAAVWAKPEAAQNKPTVTAKMRR